MPNKNICKLCDRFIISTRVEFRNNELIITIPEGCYCNCEKYCLVIAQKIPDNTTIKAKVVIQIDGGSVFYPLVKCNCNPVTACAIHTRTKYAVQVCTSTDSGVFKMLGTPYCCQPEKLKCIDGYPPEEEFGIHAMRRKDNV